MRIDYTSFPNDKFVIVFSELSEETYELLSSSPNMATQLCAKTGAANLIITKDVVHFGEAEEKATDIGDVTLTVEPGTVSIEEINKQVGEALDKMNRARGGYVPGGLIPARVSPSEEIYGSKTLLVPDYHLDTQLVDMVARIRYQEQGSIFGLWDSLSEDYKRSRLVMAEASLKKEVARARNTEEV